MVEVADGIGLHQIIIPCVAFLICFAYQTYEFTGNHVGDARAQQLFKSVRSGWVTDNYMKGQAAVNTTRDYIRATVFFANTAIVLATFVAGYAGTKYTDCSDGNGGCSAEDWLLIAKLGLLAAMFLTIFFVSTQCTRFAVHFSFCINTREIDGVPMPQALMVKVFDHAHKYYSLGIRLYFGTIPVFAWLFHAWTLVIVTPLYLYLVRGLECIDFLEDEVAEIQRIKLLHSQSRSADAAGSASTPSLNAMAAGNGARVADGKL